MAVPDFGTWKDKVLNPPQHLDVDGAYGDQCVDVALDYAIYCFPDHGWAELLGHGNAKDLFAAANDAFFDKIANDPSDPNQVPNQGNIIIYDQTSTNPFGHIAVVDSPVPGGVNVIQQDGFLDLDANGNAHGPVFEVFRPWSRSHCIGWLRPKDLSPTPVEVPVAAVETPAPEVVTPEPIVVPVVETPPIPEPVAAPVPDSIPATITSPSDPIAETVIPAVETPTPQPVDAPKDSLLTTIIKLIVSLALKIWNAQLKKG